MAVYQSICLSLYLLFIYLIIKIAELNNTIDSNPDCPADLKGTEWYFTEDGVLYGKVWYGILSYLSWIIKHYDYLK